MDKYPSIPGSTGQEFREFDALVFDKLDGSNLSATYSPKRGFYKFGTRKRMFDVTDPVFGCAVKMFAQNWTDDSARLCRDNKYENITLFAEFLGDNSFAGWHDESDTKRLVLFDVNPYKHGILGPKKFIKLFEGKPNVVKVLGDHRWTRGFVERVWRGELSGISLEGVVGKSGDGHNQIRAKAKTKAWIEKVKSRYIPEEADKLINS